MRRSHLLLAPFLALALPLLAACGDGGDDARANTEDLAKSLEETGLDRESADCAAKAYQEAGLSKETLAILLDADYANGETPDLTKLNLEAKDIPKLIEASQKVAEECFGAEVGAEPGS